MKFIYFNTCSLDHFFQPQGLKLLAHLLTFLLCSLAHFNTLAQQEGRIETDRPDQTECPFIVKKGYIQAEMGFNKSLDGGQLEYVLPTTLLKYGLSKSIELRYVSTLQGSSTFRFHSEALGLKWRLMDPVGWKPRTAVIVHYNFRDEKRDVSDQDLKPHSWSQIVLTLQNDLYKNLGIGYNFGVEFHENGTAEGIYRIAPSINIGKRGYAYAEVFGRFPNNSVTEHWFDGGFAYYASDNLKLDVSAGNSFTNSANWYVAVGVSFRVKVVGKQVGK